MGKQRKWKYEEKLEIVKEFRKGASISQPRKNMVLKVQELLADGTKNMKKEF